MSYITSIVGEFFTPEGPVVNPKHQSTKWLTEERYAEMNTTKWMPKIEQHFLDGVLISQTIQYTPEGEKESYPKKQWVGLTADEMESLYKLATYMDETDCIYMLALAEEKLKEKNYE
jgi:hypothetical protein